MPLLACAQIAGFYTPRFSTQGGHFSPRHAKSLAKRGDVVMRKEATILAAAVALGGLLAVSSVSKAYALGYTFTDIGAPGSQPGSTGDFVVNINNLGQVVGSYVDSKGNIDGFLYSGGKYITIDAPGFASTTLQGINDFGQVVGIAYDSSGNAHNFIETRARAILMAEPPSIDRGELTDKGYINQRAGLERRSADVARIYAETPDEDIIVVD
jgi:hypothetical protein